MGLGLTVKPFYVYVLTLKMNQSLSQNIRHINTTIKNFVGAPKMWGPWARAPYAPCSCMSISKKNLLYSEKYRSRSVDCVLIAIKEIMKEKFH